MGFPPLLNLSTRLSTAALPGQTTKMAKTLESMFQIVAYRPTVYRTGVITTIIYCMFSIMYNRWWFNFTIDFIYVLQPPVTALFCPNLGRYSMVDLFVLIVWLLVSTFSFSLFTSKLIHVRNLATLGFLKPTRTRWHFSNLANDLVQFTF